MAKNGKNNFLLPNRLDDIVAKLSDKQAGVLFKSILGYANKGTMAEFEDGMVAVVFEMAKQEIDYNADQYVKTCMRNAENGKLGGAPKGNTNAKKQPTACFTTQNNRTVEKTTENNPKQPKTSETSQDDVDVDNSSYVVRDIAIHKQHTAQKSAGPRKLTDLQKFAKAVADRFEEPMDKVQLGIWYKRNCRCLTDILNFCGKNIPLGLETISVCVRRLEKAGLSGGYEAVARNLPEYLAQARKQMEVINAGN